MGEGVLLVPHSSGRGGGSVPRVCRQVPALVSPARLLERRWGLCHFDPSRCVPTSLAPMDTVIPQYASCLATSTYGTIFSWSLN
jgi:hypothetical protein